MKPADYVLGVSSGKLSAIPGGLQAFEPNPLPPDWQMPNEFWPLIRDAWGTIKELNGIGRVLPNPSILLKPLENREAIQSSRIEGTFATARELLLFERSGASQSLEHGRANEWREVWNYRQALLHGAQSGLPISKRLIRELHAVLLTNVRGEDKSPGEFRRVQVGIRGTRENPEFVPSPWQSVEVCLDQLEHFIHQNDDEIEPLIRCFLVHYQFETIHPFRDGNGRVGRLLLSLMIQKACQLSHPWLFVSQYFERHKEEYFELLYRVSARSDWTSWIRFCLEATTVQAKEALSRCERLLDTKKQLAEQLAPIKGSNKLLPIIDLFLDMMYVSSSDIRDRFQLSFPTATAYLKKLSEHGIAKSLEETSPKLYYCPVIWQNTYGDLGNDSSDV